MTTSCKVSTYYFPTIETRGAGGIGEGYAKWYSKCLKELKEPNLCSMRDDAILTYRFTIIPTWGNPISVRAVKLEDQYRLYSRRLNGEGGYKPGRLVETNDVLLSDMEANSLDVLIASANLFAMPTEEVGIIVGTDGEQWILEGVSKGKYHVIHRWCASTYKPNERGLSEVLKLCGFLIDKSGLSERPKNLGNEILLSE